MARLLDMLNTDTEIETDDFDKQQEIKDELLESILILTEMIEDGDLKNSELAALNSAVDSVIEELDDFDDFDDEDGLYEKKMSPHDLMLARKRRKKNKAKLKAILKKKKRCYAKFSPQDYEKFSCNVKGKKVKKDRKRSIAAKRGARSR